METKLRRLPSGAAINMVTVEYITEDCEVYHADSHGPLRPKGDDPHRNRNLREVAPTPHPREQAESVRLGLQDELPEAAEKERDEATAQRDARPDVTAGDAALGVAVRGVLDNFMWDHATVRAEVESDRLAETVEGCIFVAIERAIRPADFALRAHAKAGV